MDDSFFLEALVDFPDDALRSPVVIAPEHIDAMMSALKARGVRRVNWGYYGDGHGGFFMPAAPVENQGEGPSKWFIHAETYQQLGNPLRVAAAAAHRHGLTLYAYYKPYETGPAMLFPEGSREAQRWGRLGHIGGRLSWMDRFVVDHPELRIKRLADNLPTISTTGPIRALKLIKKDDSPTRVTAERLQLFASRLNHQYRQLHVEFDLYETVKPSSREVCDLDGAVLTRKGDPVRVPTLSGLRIDDPFVLVATDFTDGPADFENAGTDLLVALDADGREILGVFSTGGTVWNADRVDLREWGLMFDYGFGRRRMRLDKPSTSGGWHGRGLVGFARGHNAYLPGALCETEPAVVDYWLSCIQEMLDAGVDGVDFREESHSTHTDFPEEYGFNDVVLAECARRGADDIAQIRGEAYTEFLRRAHTLIHDAGKRMRINLQIDWYRPNPPGSRKLAYPANLNFEWQRWIDEGLMDEAILRFFALPFDCLYEDEIAREIIARCQDRGLPMTVNRYIRQETLREEFRRIRQDGRFRGFILYETCNFIDFFPDGTAANTWPEIDALAGDGG